MSRFASVYFTDVSLTGQFWRERLETVLTRTIPSQYKKLDEEGVLESLLILDPPPPLRIPRNAVGFTTQYFWDSDIGKWIEAASYALRHRRDETIESQIDDIVEKLEKAQLPDGYLNCWYIGRELENRWTNLRDRHELYNAGHLLEGAIAYFQATGRRRMLEVMERYLDHIRETFGPETGKKNGYPGHQEIEIALIRLYHLTGEKKHLDLAAYFINERGKEPHYFDIEALARGDDPKNYHFKNHEYSQAHMPVREQDKVVGHAVRAMYMYSAMADLAAELEDAALRHACEVLWKDVTTKRMYVTGGFGPSAHNEGFTREYDLPNDTAYAETCASVAMVFWAQRMLNFDLDGHYADVLELALFNGTLSGLSRDGEHYFYENKLESDGTHRRWAWHPCPCCTMNASRLIASVGSYFYSVGENALAVHLYGGNVANVEIGGTRVKVTETSNYPWEGAISITLEPEVAARFALKLRVPGWADGAKAMVNGETVQVDGKIDRGYLTIDREWTSGDIVNLDLPLPIERKYAHPAVKADQGKVALRRGPLVYCFEAVDNTEPVANLILPRDAWISARTRDDLFDGTVTLMAEGQALDEGPWQDRLYDTRPPQTRAARLTAVPYYIWANRESGAMRVWIPED